MATKILALGDSWFHYPSHMGNNGEFPFANGVGNIIYFLFKNFNLDIYYDETSTSEMYDAKTHKLKSSDDVLGCCGEELLIMTRDDQPSWLDLLRTKIKMYSFQTDKFIILLSGGGNDIADTHLTNFINDDMPSHPAPDPLTLINSRNIEYVINTQLKEAYQKIFNYICAENPGKEFHFVLHGYAYPPVNGRGVLDKDNQLLHNIFDHLFQKMFPGPWLAPTFINKNILISNPASGRDRCEIIINNFIKMFNDMLQTLTCMHPNCNLHYIDLRNIVNQPNVDSDWCNELHFNRNNFVLAAQKFSDVIKHI